MRGIRVNGMIGMRWDGLACVVWRLLVDWSYEESCWGFFYVLVK
jgi:hypothetical protein